MSDIVLDGDTVFVDGHWTHVRTWDLMLDAADRRRSGEGSRRALVHDFGDGLTINFRSDYPGGVTIEGDVRVPGRLSAGGRDVGEVLAAIDTRVAALQASFESRIATLEEQVRILIAMAGSA